MCNKNTTGKDTMCFMLSECWNKINVTEIGSNVSGFARFPICSSSGLTNHHCTFTLHLNAGITVSVNIPFSNIHWYSNIPIIL